MLSPFTVSAYAAQQRGRLPATFRVLAGSDSDVPAPAITYQIVGDRLV
jgi:hypothetical protein